MTTDRQQAYLQAIEEHWRLHGVAPTYRELGLRLGVWAPAVCEMLGILRARGLVQKTQGAARTLRLTEAGQRALEGA